MMNEFVFLGNSALKAKRVEKLPYGTSIARVCIRGNYQNRKDYVEFSFYGKSARILGASERINIGFSKDGRKIAFQPSSTEGFRYTKAKSDRLRFKTSNPNIVKFCKTCEGEVIPRIDTGGIVYFDPEYDEQLKGISAKDQKKGGRSTVSQKSESAKPLVPEAEPAKPVLVSFEDNFADRLPDGTKVYVSTFDCKCIKCGQPIKVITRSGEKGKPVNPELVSYMKSNLSTHTFVTPKGIVETGIRSHSKKSGKDIKCGYIAHWETCAANNTGRK